LREKDGQTSLSYSAAASELLGKRFTFYYKSTTDADRDELHATQDAKIPACAIEVILYLKLDGDVLSREERLDLGQDQHLDLETIWTAPLRIPARGHLSRTRSSRATTQA